MASTPDAPAMKHCPDCRAPNPANRTTCYACGQGLDKPRLGTVLPGEPTRPCPNCQAAIGLSVGFCPQCGRAVTVSMPFPPATEVDARIHSGDARLAAEAAAARLERMMQAPTPAGWTMEPPGGNGGTVRLRRTLWGRFNRDAAAPVGGTMVVVFLMYALSGTRRLHRVSAPGAPVSGTEYAPLILIALLALGMLIWVFLVEEELTVGPGYLELRKGWGRWEWRKRSQGQFGMLVIETRDSYGRSGATTTRTLRVEAGGRRWTIDSRTRQRGLMGGLFMRETYDDDVAGLARFLAAQTGWQVIDPSRGL